MIASLNEISYHVAGNVMEKGVKTVYLFPLHFKRVIAEIQNSSGIGTMSPTPTVH